MYIKKKDIAKELGLSPATVSLALNGRPGVSQETKKKIEEYVRQKTYGEFEMYPYEPQTFKGTVMILNYIKNGIIMDRVARYPLIADEATKIAESRGYRFVVRIYDEQRESMEFLLEECRSKKIKAMYILAAEMTQGDIYPFLELKIPIVTGDNLFCGVGVDSFLIDNREGISRCVDYLVDKGHSHIVYLAENIDIFNFRERREAFVQEMARRECGDASNRIRYLGSNVEEVHASMCRYIAEGIKRTTAFVLESSIVSLGVGKALLEHQIRVPGDVSLIGFDALPPVSLPGIDLTLIKGTHTKRHLAAMEHLLRHMEGDNDEIMRVYYKTRLLEGSSVFDKTKYIYR